jgi:hypothetical protein
MVIVGIAAGVPDDAISDDEIVCCVAYVNSATGTGSIYEEILNYPGIVCGSISRGYAV